MKYTLARVVFEFFPIVGGSVTHIIELSKAMNPHLKKQIIIAPDFGHECREFDDSLGMQVVRVSYCKSLAFGSLLASPATLFLYARKAVQTVAEITMEDHQAIDIIQVHGDILGAFVVFLSKFHDLKIPVIVMRHGGCTDASVGSLFLDFLGSLVLMRHGGCTDASVGSLFLDFLGSILVTSFPPQHILVLDDGTDVRGWLRRIEAKGIQSTIVPHGIDSAFFNPQGTSHSYTHFTVLFHQRLIPWKRPDLAILAFQRFLEITPKEKRNVKLIIIGPGDTHVTQLRTLAHDLSLDDYVEFLGEKSQKETRRYLRKSDVVIGTSLISNMGRATQEAMSCAKPVVVFGSGGTERLIKHMENGLLVEPENIRDFALMLKLLYMKPKLRERLGEKARRTIVEERNWEARIRMELEVCEKLVRERQLTDF